MYTKLNMWPDLRKGVFRTHTIYQLWQSIPSDWKQLSSWNLESSEYQHRLIDVEYFRFVCALNPKLHSSKFIELDVCGRPLFANPVTYMYERQEWGCITHASNSIALLLQNYFGRMKNDGITPWATKFPWTFPRVYICITLCGLRILQWTINFNYKLTHPFTYKRKDFTTHALKYIESLILLILCVFMIRCMDLLTLPWSLLHIIGRL